MCRGLEAVPIETSITKEIFLQNYAYSGRPVLIKQATSDWLALEYFDYHFFRQLYEKFPDSAEMVDSDCNFLRYQTEFLTFVDFLKMDDDKVKRLDWYVGCIQYFEVKTGDHNLQQVFYLRILTTLNNFFRLVVKFDHLEANCQLYLKILKSEFNQTKTLFHIYAGATVKRVMKELRKYYERPFFLPDDSVSSTLDWIFIGGAGPGAGLHIDVVDASSWQAQIRGEKIWTLVPPYECEAVCQQINVTVKQGDIFVLDTNIWFHRTEILEGEISITIGSEYD
ncbi:hypothetical protein BSL78_24764 [Apostichopus japonicus]|uniref:Cupin-like domain-containing protein n=1 Tax=Stichopus japonicus TaxID=307972 RepID=A0A2G8JRK7_STIJA|nr:hypothetical protein BSL78_24764 [Apostichopus japonicus]